MPVQTAAVALSPPLQNTQKLEAIAPGVQTCMTVLVLCLMKQPCRLLPYAEHNERNEKVRQHEETKVT
jgi:hypothetical protein